MELSVDRAAAQRESVSQADYNTCGLIRITNWSREGGVVESGGQATVGAVPAHARLIQMAIGYWVSRLVYVAARLGLADHLAGGPKNAAELAEPTQTHAPWPA